MNEIFEGKRNASPSLLSICDPDTFVAGAIYQHVDTWEKLCANLVNSEEIMSWVRSGVSIDKYVTHFNGDFAGKSYDSEYLVSRGFLYHVLCKNFTDFVNRPIEDRIDTGAVGVISKVSDSAPPFLVMPLTVEPNKPLCHDKRYLNCWIMDMPFSLDSLLNLMRYVEGHFQTKQDEKFGYNHVLLDPLSRQLVGFQWEGWWFVNNFFLLAGKHRRIFTSRLD